MKLTGRQFIEKIPFETWITFSGFRVFYGCDWCYFIQAWNEIEGWKYLTNNSETIILNEDFTQFKKISLINK